FSSRRRHTRFSRDWSSDVSSPDLREADVVTERNRARPQDQLLEPFCADTAHSCASAPRKGRAGCARDGGAVRRPESVADLLPNRSEERRVGKACRTRGWREPRKTG